MVGKLLLTDSTMPVNFCKAGANCALAMLEYLGEGLYMVADVKEELERKAEADGFSALRRFLDEFPDRRVRTLSLELLADVAAVKKVVQIAGSHSKEDAGEIASVLYAASRRDEGEVFDVITDDGEGKKLARDRQLTVVTTQSLVVTMVCVGALEYRDGDRVWRQCFSNPQRRKGFKERVERDCPHRLVAASR